MSAYIGRFGVFPVPLRRFQVSAVGLFLELANAPHSRTCILTVRGGISSAPPTHVPAYDYAVSDAGFIDLYQ
jgi:hypothetical protein